MDIVFEAIAEELKDELHPDFDPPYTTFNVGLIRGGSAKNVIPGECRFTIEWRPIPGQDPHRVLDLLSKAVESERQLPRGFQVRIAGTDVNDKSFFALAL